MEHPLNGFVVAVTSSRRGEELARIIEGYGGTPYIAPTLGMELKEGSDVLIEFLNCEPLDIVIFLTGPGTESVLSAGRDAGVGYQLLENLKSTPSIVARSSKPRSVLCDYGIKDNVIIPKDATLDGILDLLGPALGAKRIGIFWHGSRSEQFVNALQYRGATVLEFTTYVYSQDLGTQSALLLDSLGFKRAIPPNHARIGELIDKIILGKIDVITFTSPPGVSNLFRVSESLSKKDQLILAMNAIIVVSIGPSTTQELEKNGVYTDVQPNDEFRMGKMLHELAEYVRKNGRKKCVAIAR